MKSRAKKQSRKALTRPKRSGGAPVNLERSLRIKIEKALGHQSDLAEADIADAAFHLADWFDELQELNRLYSSRQWNPELAKRVIYEFVVHAPAHLAAAHRILIGFPITDVFGTGAVKGTIRPKKAAGSDV